MPGAIASKQPGKAFPLQAAIVTPETEKPSAVFTALGFMFLAEREGQTLSIPELQQNQRLGSIEG